MSDQALEVIEPESSKSSAISSLSSAVTGTAGNVYRQLKSGVFDVAGSAGRLTFQTIMLPKAFLPVGLLLASEEPVKQEALSSALDEIFEALYEHPVTSSSRNLTLFLRDKHLIPNENTTEELIRFVVDQTLLRSPIPTPDIVVNEFWQFFQELFSDPEIRGLAELNLDIARLVLRIYEPMLVELINMLKEVQLTNRRVLTQMTGRVSVVRGDILILKRQIKALRYIKPFLQTDPKDFASQAEIVAQMVREFGPFFVKMAQVAASNADFLPNEIAKELEVFQEDVEPMDAAEVIQAFKESFGCLPSDMYFDFNPAKPLKSGSIGSVFIAHKPVIGENGEQILKKVLVKVGRHNLEREFLMGKASIGLVLLSTHYWAPHSKIAPFLEDLLKQLDEFIHGFEQELDFEAEAEIQTRFWLRCGVDGPVRVPEVYRSSRRVIEMEFAENAVSINSAIAKFRPRNEMAFRRKIGRRFMHLVLTHMFVFKECHGDLHPGNVMVTKEGTLYLIDWGNTIQMEGKWPYIIRYLKGALRADPHLLTDVLIDVSTHPEQNRARRQEIFEALCEALERRGIELDKQENVMRAFWNEGYTGILKRLNTSAQLVSRSQQIGIVISSEYLHLSRSLFALAGTYGSIYSGMPPETAIIELLKVLSEFPIKSFSDQLVSEWYAPASRPFKTFLDEVA